MPDTHELEVLRVLTRKYGSHYIRKYFGFRMADFAKGMGVAKSTFSSMLNGRRRMNDTQTTLFVRVFQDLKVEEKTRDFKESADQVLTRQLTYKRRIYLTGAVFGCIVLPMAILTSLFLKPSVVNSRQYLYYDRVISTIFLLSIIVALVFFTRQVPFFFSNTALFLQDFCV